MFNNLFKRKSSGINSGSPVVRDIFRRLDGTPDDSETGKAIRDAEAVMREASDVISSELLNRNEATIGTSKAFMAGVAIGYSLKHGVHQNDADAMAAVVRCALYRWTSTRSADYMADCLGSYLTDEEWAGPVIERGVEAVDVAGSDVHGVVSMLKDTLEEWYRFDTDAYYEKQKRQAFA